MRKLLLMILSITILSACSMAQVKADDQISSESLLEFCEINRVFLEKLFYDAARINNYTRRLIHEDTENFVPLLFAQAKMENLSILLFATYAEIARVAEVDEVSSETLWMLDKYLYFLEQDLTKAKLFEGMIADQEGEEYIILEAAVNNITIAYDLITDIKKGLEELR